MAKAQLYSVQEGQIVDWDLTVENDEIVARHNDETLKFPGGLSKQEFLDLVEAHNKANDGVKAITKEELEAQEQLQATNEQLLADLDGETADTAPQE